MNRKTTTLIPLTVNQGYSRNTDPKTGKRQVMNTITFWDYDNRCEVITYAIKGFGNYNRWKKIVNYFKLYSDTVILQGNFRFEDLDVIDADSTFVIAQESVSWDDVAEIIEGCVV